MIRFRLIQRQSLKWLGPIAAALLLWPCQTPAGALGATLGSTGSTRQSSLGRPLIQNGLDGVSLFSGSVQDRSARLIDISTAPGPLNRQRKPAVQIAFATALRVRAPSLEGGLELVNTERPVRLEDLRGKVVLLDFWTYCCINCMHMLPALKKLEEKYPNELVIVGVHSAKFAAERDSNNILKAVRRYDIRHPVVNDARLAIWNRYRVSVWPSFRLIDPEGFLVAGSSGEVPFSKLDAAIRPLIRNHRKKGTLDPAPLDLGLDRPQRTRTPLRFPGKVLADQRGGRLFIADSSHDRIVVASLDGDVIDVIGTGRQGADNGPYDEATFNDPQGMALNGQTLYVADNENHLIRQIDLTAKVVKTLAGTGRQAPVGSRGGRSRLAALSSPWDLTLAGGNLYVAMAGPHQIWVLSLSGRGVWPYSGSGREDIQDGPLRKADHAQPSGITTDGNRLYVVDSEGSALRAVSLSPGGRVETLVGASGMPTGQSLFRYGDQDGVGRGALLQHPVGVTFYRGVLYVADTYNHKIKRIDPRRGVCQTLLGDGQPGNEDDPPQFHEPTGLSAAGGKLYIADTNNHVIRVADLKSRAVRTLRLEGLTPPAPQEGRTDKTDSTGRQSR